MTTPSLPESLRRAIGEDLQPVRPLPPVWMRLLAAIAVTATGLAIVVVFFNQFFLDGRGVPAPGFVLFTLGVEIQDFLLLLLVCCMKLFVVRQVLNVS